MSESTGVTGRDQQADPSNEVLQVVFQLSSADQEKPDMIITLCKVSFLQ